LSKLSVDKRKVLDADLARELERERLRMEFARHAAEFTRWAKDTSDEVNVTNFGFLLEEVDAFKSKLDASNTEIISHGDAKQGEYKEVNKKMLEMKVKDNVYTTLTLDDLAKSRSDLDGSVDKRNKAYATELARLKANDKLCRDFAGVADPFVKSMMDAKDEITSSKADLEEQLKYVKSKIDSLPQEATKLKPINDLNSQMEAAGIANNKYTTLSSKDVEV